jgi:hypothetical protein
MTNIKDCKLCGSKPVVAVRHFHSWGGGGSPMLLRVECKNGCHNELLRFFECGGYNATEEEAIDEWNKHN